MTKTINGIRVATLTETQAAIINNARQHSSDDERKQIKREVFAVVKAKYGIPENVRLSAVTSNPESPSYLLLHTGGKKNGPKRAFRLGEDGKFTGSYASQDDLFPPAPAQDQASDTPQSSGSVFGGAAGNWFRLDSELVADLLTDGATDMNADDLADWQGTPGVNLPTPHLMLAGRNDLAITADGSIYRKVD